MNHNIKGGSLMVRRFKQSKYENELFGTIPEWAWWIPTGLSLIALIKSFFF